MPSLPAGSGLRRLLDDSRSRFLREEDAGDGAQGEESLRGFYLWDATSSYSDPKTGREKTYKYKESHVVSLSAP